jgi:hypothetical protein
LVLDQVSWCWWEIDQFLHVARGEEDPWREKLGKEFITSSSIHDFFIKASDSCMMAKKGLEFEPNLVPNTPCPQK